MDPFARPFVPPAPEVPATDLPTWKMIWRISRNTLAAWPDYSFEVVKSRSNILGSDGFVFHDPDGIRHVLMDNAAHYVKPVAMLRVIRPAAGDGVLLSEGARWRSQRRMLAPLFSPSAINGLLPHFHAAAEGMIRRMESRPTARLSEAFHQTTLDAVLRSLFSLSVEGEHRDLARIVRSYLDGPGRPTVLDAIAKREHDFSFANWPRKRFQTTWRKAVDDIIATRKAAPMQDRPRDLLDLLLAVRDAETGQPLPDAEVRDECSTALAAGFETTSRLMFWASYLLSQDPQEQAHIRAEVTAFPPEGAAALDDLSHWPRLRNLLLEALRLYPPVPTVIRDAVASDRLMDEDVHPGTRIWISPWILHRHRRFWKHPTHFIPDRFAGQTAPWTSCGPFIPFGGGPRICIGAAFSLAEAQILMAHLLARFSLSLHGVRPVMPIGGVTIMPDHDPPFRLERA